MSITAFCPGHITCFFRPVRTDDLLTTGSRGVGIRTDLGTSVTLEERSDRQIKVVMDGKDCECRITRYAISQVSDRGYDVTIRNDLPVGYGFGMSASGAIASALCACEFEGKSESEAFRSAHTAEIRGGGGLGDVSGLLCASKVPVRAVAGLPPYGKVIDSGVDIGRFTVAVLGGPLNTGITLSRPEVSEALQREGSIAVDSFMAAPSLSRLFGLSEDFSSKIGLETRSLKDAFSKLRLEGHAGMCMLGHSIFTDVSKERTEDLLGPGAEVFACSATDSIPRITHRG